MAVPMPAVVVLIFCKTVIAGPEDPNSSYTGYQNRAWAVEHGLMQCFRKEVQLYDLAEANGAQAQPFNSWRCNVAGLSLGSGYDHDHPNSRYRYFRSACPTPIVDSSGVVVGWHIPECGEGPGVNTEGSRMVCDMDTQI